MRKMSLVNETLRPRRDRDVWLSVRDETETETFPHFSETETRPRRWENASRDRLETETSRPRPHPWVLEVWIWAYYSAETNTQKGLIMQQNTRPQIEQFSREGQLFNRSWRARFQCDAQWRFYRSTLEQWCNYCTPMQTWCSLWLCTSSLAWCNNIECVLFQNLDRSRSI